MDIIEATPSHLPTIIEMGEMLQNESKAYEPELIFNYDKSYRHYANELSNPDARVIIAVVDKEIVGYQYSFVTVLDYLSSHNRECTLEALYVDPKFRNQGIGATLMREAVAWASDIMKVDRVKANIYSNNRPSASIHEKYGFAPYCTEYIKLINSNEPPRA
ncbi:GNAT family N-acetyltransferase [Candidatus Saccharibacteria bacterium]|nr:MAG: GNAT family N-acetyltransferase [Candidatus Saccharibacteria bacterium]